MAGHIQRCCKAVEILVTTEPVPGCDLYHFFRPYDLMEVLKWGFQDRAVTTFHGYLPGLTDHRCYKRAYEHAEAIACVCKKLGYEYLAECGIPRDKLAHIPAGADPQMFDCRKWPTGNFVVGIVGRYYGRHGLVDDAKNIQLIVETMTQFAKSVEVTLLVVGFGWGPLIDAMIRERIPVIYADRQGRNCVYEDYPALYNKMDCLLVASKHEGGPVAVFEALQCGRPIVGAAVGVIPDIIQDRETGWVRKHDAEAMCNGLEHALEARERFRDGDWSKCREVGRYYTWDRWGKAHEQLYLEVLQCQRNKELAPVNASS